MVAKAANEPSNTVRKRGSAMLLDIQPSIVPTSLIATLESTLQIARRNNSPTLPGSSEVRASRNIEPQPRTRPVSNSPSGSRWKRNPRPLHWTHAGNKPSIRLRDVPGAARPGRLVRRRLLPRRSHDRNLLSPDMRGEEAAAQERRVLLHDPRGVGRRVPTLPPLHADGARRVHARVDRGAGRQDRNRPGATLERCRPPRRRPRPDACSALVQTPPRHDLSCLSTRPPAGPGVGADPLRGRHHEHRLRPRLRITQRVPRRVRSSFWRAARQESLHHARRRDPGADAARPARCRRHRRRPLPSRVRRPADARDPNQAPAYVHGLCRHPGRQPSHRTDPAAAHRVLRRHADRFQRPARRPRHRLPASGVGSTTADSLR